MANSTKNISFSTFQRKITRTTFFPPDHVLDVYEIPDIPRLFPRNIRCSFQNLRCRTRSQLMYHQNFVLKIHLKGCSTGVVENRTYIFRPGTAMLIFPFQQHYIHHMGGKEKNDEIQQRILFNFTLNSDELQQLLPLKNQILTLEPSDYGLLMDFAECCRNSDKTVQSNCPYFLNRLLFSCLSRVNQNKQENYSSCESPFIQKFFQFLGNRYVQNPTVAELAAELKISETALRSRLKKETDCSPGVLIRDLRLKQAAQLLCFTDRTVKEIALQCGFSNAFTFSRSFRKKFHISPKQFRAKNKAMY